LHYVFLKTPHPTDDLMGADLSAEAIWHIARDTVEDARRSPVRLTDTQAATSYELKSLEQCAGLLPLPSRNDLMQRSFGGILLFEDNGTAIVLSSVFGRTCNVSGGRLYRTSLEYAGSPSNVFSHIEPLERRLELQRTALAFRDLREQLAGPCGMMMTLTFVALRRWDPYNLSYTLENDGGIAGFKCYTAAATANGLYSIDRRTNTQLDGSAVCDSTEPPPTGLVFQESPPSPRAQRQRYS
jgi:hypothetical protein